MTDQENLVNANYLSYHDKSLAAITSNMAKFRGNKLLNESYRRIACVNALKIDLFDQYSSKEASHFFYEAHNDALLSHLNASFGSWRPALQALRSFLENTMAAIYYHDHPVELHKWKNGDFNIQPRELREYVCDHPAYVGFSTDVGLKALLDQEYSTLSKAVHGSNNLFRMTTADGTPNVANANDADLGKWATRERAAVNLAAAIVVGFYNHKLSNAQMPNLRSALSVALSPKTKTSLAKVLSINI